MGLWLRISTTAETWPDLERTGRQRYWDGSTLASSESGSANGAVYLWGYVAELLLKAAVVRLRGVPAADDISPTLRAQGIRHHRLNDLAQDLITVRAAVFRSANPIIEGALRNHVDVLAQNWDVELRYRSADPTEQELHEVNAAADWLVQNYIGLL